MANHRDARLDEAVARLRAGKADALTLLQALHAEKPDDAEALSFLGLAQVQIEGANAAGLVNLEHAAALDPMNPLWKLNLGIGHARAGNHASSDLACREAFERSGGSVNVILPWTDSLFGLGKFAEAAHLLGDLVRLQPSREAFRRLAFARGNLGDPEGALRALANAMGAAPTLEERRMQARLQYQAQHLVAAKDTALSLLRDRPGDADIAVLAAEILAATGDETRSTQVLQDAFRSSPRHAAIVAALLARAAPGDDVVAGAFDVWRDDARPPAERRAIGFVLARHLHNAGDYEAAFECAQAANDLVPAGEFPLTAIRRRAERALEAFRERTRVASLPTTGVVYLVGPPRSGGTLLQTVLAAAPGVASVGERGALLPYLARLFDGGVDGYAARAAAALSSLREPDARGLAAQAPDKQVFVDKTPHHAHYAGAIALVHPGARFVDTRRDPMDVAMSIWFHEFPASYAYSSRLQDIADYLLWHRELIGRWQDAGLDLVIHDHDAFVRDPVHRAAALFATLALPFEARYLDATNRDSNVQTHSVHQVRGEISDRYSRGWEPYRAFVPEIADRLDALRQG